jgi:hypothetical protein
MTWAPFSIVGEEIQRLSGNSISGRHSTAQYEMVAPDEADSDAAEQDIPMSSPVTPYSQADLEVGAGTRSNEMTGI